MEFPWRCNVDTIAMDLKVSWEMSVKSAFTGLWRSHLREGLPPNL